MVDTRWRYLFINIFCCRWICRPHMWKLSQWCPDISLWLGDRVLRSGIALGDLVLLLELPRLQ